MVSNICISRGVGTYCFCSYVYPQCLAIGFYTENHVDTVRMLLFLCIYHKSLHLIHTLRLMCNDNISSSIIMVIWIRFEHEWQYTAYRSGRIVLVYSTIILIME